MLLRTAVFCFFLILTGSSFVAAQVDSFKVPLDVAAWEFTSLQPGSVIDSCYVKPGTQYKGCDEGYIFQFCEGFDEDAILVRWNKCDGMRIGRDPHYGLTGLWPKWGKMRYHNSGITLLENWGVSIVGDTTGNASDGEDHATHNRQGAVFSYNTGWLGDSYGPDSNIIIRHNHWILDSLAPSVGFNPFTIGTDDSTITEAIVWDNYEFGLTGTGSAAAVTTKKIGAVKLGKVKL